MIFYRDGYKYQLRHEYAVALSFVPPAAISHYYVEFDVTGLLTIRNGYAWDGPSGPTFATGNFMRGSLVHDALYQLMREELLDRGRYRELADRELQQLCREDGMSALRAWFVYRAVRVFGDPTADPANDKPVLTAP